MVENIDETTQFSDNGRVYLRKLNPDDINQNYLDWFRDSVVTEYLDAKNLTYQEVVDYMVEGHQSGLHVMLGIFCKDGDKHIGNVKIGPINWKHGTSGLVTFIGERQYWGQGIAREAVSIGTRVAFDVLGLRKLSDGVADGNGGSVKAYTAAGWCIEATMRGHHLIDGDPRDRIVISCFNPIFFPEQI